jgi:hypothetical protein
VATADGGFGTGNRGNRGHDGGADRHGPRWAGAGPLPPHRLTRSRVGRIAVTRL